MLLAPLLLAFEAWRTRRRAPAVHRAPGIAGLAAAPLAMLAGLESGSPTLGLGGLALGIVGAAAITGRPAPATALLAFWLVPVPVFVLERTSPELETLWMRAVTALAGALGAAFEHAGPVAHARSGARVEFFAVDQGVVLAHGMAMVGLLQALRRDAKPASTLGRVIAYGALGFGLQGLVLLTAAMRAAGGEGGAALETLVRGPTLIVAVAVAWVVLVEPRRPSARPPSTRQPREEPPASA